VAIVFFEVQMDMYLITYNYMFAKLKTVCSELTYYNEIKLYIMHNMLII
jgi:hypothetical protein